jgi:hypothetical protein
LLKEKAKGIQGDAYTRECILYPTFPSWFVCSIFKIRTPQPSSERSARIDELQEQTILTAKDEKLKSKPFTHGLNFAL